jgi:hypothetical protein
MPLTQYSPQSRSSPRSPLQEARRLHYQDPTLLASRLRAGATRNRQLHPAFRLEGLR